MSKEIKKITADEVYPVSMRRLGDRPNSSSAQGRGGMSSAELKGFMDKYPELVKERLNELIDMCNADSNDGIAKAIKTPVINPETGDEISLYDWFAYANTYLKGDGIEQIFALSDGTAQNVAYDTTRGAQVQSTASIAYKDSNTGETKSQQFTMFSEMPILPGKYVSMDANSDNDALEVKVDDTALAQDYIKIDKTLNNVMPLWYDGKISWYKLTSAANGESVAYRDGAGNSSFNKVKVNEISSIDGKYSINIPLINFSVKDTDMVVTKTANDTGTLPAGQLTHLKSIPAANIRYDDKIFVRMDPVNALDDTLNYIHIDSAQDGTYKATGKCFSITVSTRAWKVFDLEFGGSGSGTGNGIDSIETLILAHELYSGDVYGGEDGQMYNAKSIIKYRDAATNKVVDKVFYSTVHIPMVGSDYVQIAGDAANNRFVLKLNDENMSQDFFKINKAVDSAVPLYQNGKTEPIRATVPAQINTLARRDAEGNCTFNNVGLNAVQGSDGSYKTSLAQLYFSCADIYFTVAKTATDTGTIGPIDFTRIQTYPNIRINYDNQIYILQDPNTAPNGTLNYIHIDSIQDGNSGYKATGKCFSITVSTRTWQVVDLKFDTGLIYELAATPNSVARRDANGSCGFHNVSLRNAITDGNGGNISYADQIANASNPSYSERVITKTTSDTGTIDQDLLTKLTSYPQLHIQYNNQTYYRMDPTNAPDGTLNYIHLDTVQDGNGGYKAIVKYFSITVSTRAWQMVSLNLARSYTHQICVSNSTTNAKYYFTLVNNKSASYQGNAAGLINALSDTDTEFQPATRYKDGVVAALLHRSTQGYLVAEYGANNTTEQMTPTQIVVWDNVI